MNIIERWKKFCKKAEELDAKEWRAKPKLNTTVVVVLCSVLLFCNVLLLVVGLMGGATLSGISTVIMSVFMFLVSYLLLKTTFRIYRKAFPKLTVHTNVDFKNIDR